MNGNDQAVFAILLLAGGLANYRFADQIAAAFSRWIPDCWDSEPHCQRITGQLMGGAGALLFATTTLARYIA